MPERTWLNRVDKPARYTGGELNICTKDTKGKVRFALCYPDVYEVGMSHLGSRILYDILNAHEDIACERCYAPWGDAEKEMRAAGEALYALESGDALDQFDIVAFSLMHEMVYTNVLLMLDLAGIPFYADKRDENAPLIAAGGPCTLNAEPLAPFIDVMMLGDGEETVVILSQEVKRAKEEGVSKHELLKRLSAIEGFYVPSFYQVSYHEDGTVDRIEAQHGAPEKVKKAVVKDLEHAPYPLKPLVPYMSIIHDRVSLELFRGCTRGCRFCQAGYVYRPVRERTVDTLVGQAACMIQSTGYEEISLTSLSSGDYAKLPELIDRLSEQNQGKRVSLSLPSLRIDSFTKEVAEGVSQVRKTGLTFAPEAGTQRLRDIINKGVTEENLLDSVMDAFESGYSTVKLYFMIGLPGETDDDLRGIVELGKKVVECYYSMPKEKRKLPPHVTISVSPFVPKPFTPFQWEPQPTLEEIQRKQRVILEAVKPYKRIKFNTHNAKTSALEGVFARGDRRLAPAVELAYQRGARFDGWSECFDYDRWMQAFADTGIDPAFYANRTRDEKEVFPFEHLDPMISRRYLWLEKQRSVQGITTPDCRKGCQGCGLMKVCGVEQA